MTATSLSTEYSEQIKAQMPFVLNRTDLPFSGRIQGKVRDIYDLGESLLLVATDRLSAFDRPLALIPCKGQVLNLTSAWWFRQTADIVPNHLLSVVDANAVIVKKCQVFPVEFVVRGYISGTTETSLWTRYQKGERQYCGHRFADGLVKNQKLPTAILTPTTKEAHHDRPISADEIIASGLMSEAHWCEARDMALALFTRGSEIAARHGLILVDTKYEFGLDAQGRVVVVDEIHTPDSSRYWLVSSYEQRFAKGLEPENIDKEFLRLWFAANTNPYEDKTLPQAPEELVVKLAGRYIQLYEMITGERFAFSVQTESVQARILRHVNAFLKRD